MSDSVVLEEKNKVINFKKIFYQNLLLYYLLTAFFLSFYSTQIFYYDYNEQSRIASLSAIVYLLAPFLKTAYEKVRTTFTDTEILYSFSLNFVLFFLATIEILLISGQEEYYWYNGTSGAMFAWYFFIGLVVVLYKARRKIRSFMTNLYKRTVNFTRFTAKSLKKYGFKITLIPFILEWWSVRRLSTDYRAVYFAKKFIIIQSKPIKATLPGLVPNTISASIKSIFQNDIDRMQQLFKYNHIRSYSKAATLKFVMQIANPIITDLQLTLEQHLTEELLKENNNSSHLQINVDNLWKKVEKIMTQWESTFSDSEMDYKDTLLVK